jgi:hypothetical protein
MQELPNCKRVKSFFCRIEAENRLLAVPKWDVVPDLRVEWTAISFPLVARLLISVLPSLKPSSLILRRGSFSFLVSLLARTSIKAVQLLLKVPQRQAFGLFPEHCLQASTETNSKHQ